MWNETKSRYREIKEGRFIWLMEDIKNNNLVLPKGLSGKIVHSQSQVEADVWFYDDWKYKGVFGLKTDFHINGRFKGVVLNVKAQSFALSFNRKYDDGIMIDEDKLTDIPFLELDKVESSESRWYRNGQKGKEYNICDLIDNIEANFTDYVNDLDNYPNPDADEYDEVQYLFTDEALNDFYSTQFDIQLKFAKATGIFYEFMGGAVEE